MTETRQRIQIEEDSDDLLEALSVRGFEARRANGSIEVAATGEEGAWNLELVSALESWLEDRSREHLRARVGDTEYVVRSPEARRLDDTGEIPVQTEPGERGGLPALLAVLGTVLLLAAGVWFLLAAGFQLF